ncbi:conserved hypothetical protein [Parvibaculum lavamentivorans DS-1]|uniref:Pilus formation protein N-terminal domain-containing protein n=1 Tax=Parvibaculum lavamentivorans (strain DS-1 / DSM 13023 / NCIMB 13966) TaxID=402881 RepID=A7HPL8_PARL1|nr:pilus assembly protein N-terminal domain-containing protein [Parvibaculum lavamentivorans]ABS61851.1 conserved hypothetical protein [Parvibaculum lavamentivorans DS-1]
MRVSRIGKNISRVFYTAAIGAACAGLAVSASQAADFQVEMNKSKALHLGQPASTVMVGNPSIADVTVEGSKLLYVMGRSYGRTNIIALDSSGETILDINVNVVSQSASTVTLTRGGGQYTYNCTPRCERVPTIGDSPEAFDELMKQTSGAVGAGVSSSPSSNGGSISDNTPR